MEKVKIQLLQIEPMKNKIIKLGRHKIDIKPYISSEDIVLITDLCLKKMIGDADKIANSAVIHTLFDMCVVALCTNIQVDGISFGDGEQKSIDINLTAGNFETFDALCLGDLLESNIANYYRCWQTVFETMQLATINNALGLIAKNIPTQDSMSKTIEEFGKAVKEINEKDPENLKNIIRVASENNAFAQAKSEFTEKQKAEKVKKLDEAIKKNVGKTKSKK